MLVLTILPFVGLIAAVTLLWNEAVGWTDLVLLLRALRHLRLRHHDRLPPHADSPRVRGCARRSRPPCSSPDRSRSRDRRSTGRSTTAPTTPTPTRRATRTARTTASRAGRSAPSRVSCTRTWAGCSGTTAPTRSATAKDILQDRLTMTVSRLFPLWAVLTFVVPFVLGGLLTMSWKGAVTGPRLGRPRAPLLQPPRHVERQLDLPLLRQAAVRRRATSRRTTGCWRCPRSASRGTTTTTSSPRRPSTGCRGARSTCRPGSSPAGRRSGSCGTFASRRPSRSSASWRRRRTQLTESVLARRHAPRRARRPDPARRQPGADGRLRGRRVPDGLRRPAVQHRPFADPHDGARDAGRRRRPDRIRRPPLPHRAARALVVPRLVRRLPRVPRAAPARDPPPARRRGHALPAPRPARGALREAAARRDLRARVLPERARVGLRLRRQAEAALAGEARHDPRVRPRPRPVSLRLGGGRARAVHGAGARHGREGRPRQAPDRRLVAHDRLADRPGEDRLPDPEARRASCGGCSRRRPARATACSTPSPGQGRWARRRPSSAGATS